ncbi:DUF1684 domain-containing protein [Cellvibrio sp. KY-GH-1]|uniref:DUF1684 domain-containing protein n=1 Tax=Cellvibrio sp. KY-GH-1 TaxID=2303332 RepID=UPI0012466C82|nr:DUF1684 domain-containing protein [Cellvibrio sp. KY-GH-1]QEY16786.1 DUF1684 domain-containing protein [Cellvibrio sp. KY-GH-1]
MTVFDEFMNFRQQREASLRTPHGWLSVVGLYWLENERTRIGSTAECDIHIESSTQFCITFHLSNETRVFAETSCASVTVNNHPFSEGELYSDESGSPSIIRIDSISIELLRRSGKFAVRVRDSRQKKITQFPPLQWYPETESFRLPATFVAHPHDKTMPISLALGGTYELSNPGYLRFNFNGNEYQLEVIKQGNANQLFVIFKDKTNGDYSYGGGRFLFIPFDLWDEKVSALTIDFNRSISPPCAFTEAATCPLPPANNSLPFAVEAGELKPYNSFG